MIAVGLNVLEILAVVIDQHRNEACAGGVVVNERSFDDDVSGLSPRLGDLSSFFFIFRK